MKVATCINENTTSEKQLPFIFFFKRLSWFCNFAIGIPHHNIMDKREEELRIAEDLMVREGRYIMEDTSSGCARSFCFCRGVGVLPSRAPSSSRAFGFGNSPSLSLSFSFSLSLLFHLIYYPHFQLDCIISCHLAFQHHS